MRLNDIPAAQRRELLTQEALALRLDLCPRQVRNLTELGMPRLNDRAIGARFGAYPWPLALHWYVAFKVREASIRTNAATARRGTRARRPWNRVSLPPEPGAPT